MIKILFPRFRREREGEKKEHLGVFYFQLGSRIPLQKCFWILFPSLILMAGEYKGWIWAFGWIPNGECELLCFCFLWPTVPISMNKPPSLSLPFTVVNVFSFPGGLTD